MTTIEAIFNAKFKQLVDQEVPPTVAEFASWCCRAERWLWDLVACNEASALTMLAANAAAMRAEYCARAVGAAELADRMRIDPGVINIAGRDALNRIGECRRWCESFLAGPRLSVEVERLLATLRLPGKPVAEIPLPDDDVARWLDAFAKQPGRWLSTSEIEQNDDVLLGIRPERMWRKLPPELQKLIQREAGYGCRLNFSLA